MEMKFKGKIVGCDVLKQTITFQCNAPISRLPINQRAELIVMEVGEPLIKSKRIYH